MKRADSRKRLALAAVSMAVIAGLVSPAPAVAKQQKGSGGLSQVSSGYFCDTDDARENPVTHKVKAQIPIPEVTNHGGDMAFWGDLAIVGCGGDDSNLYNDGFAVVDISDPTAPRKLSDFACVASASDVAVWEDLVFLAVDRNSDAEHRGPLGEECDAPIAPRPNGLAGQVSGLAPVDEAQPDPFFQGLRIVSIADPTAPELLESVRIGLAGAHNITVVPDDEDPNNVLVFASIPTDSSRMEEGTAMPPGIDNMDHTAVVEVPIDDPGASEIVGQIAIGNYGGCHDVSFFLPRGLGVCFRVGAGNLLWDIRDDDDEPRDDGASLRRPVKIAFMTLTKNPSDLTPTSDDPAAMHSGAFSNDGNTLAVSDEAFFKSTLETECPAKGDTPAGSIWFYDLSNLDNLWGKDTAPSAGHQLPPEVSGNRWCMSKQLNVIPIATGRDVLVASYVGGGTSVVDFTDPRAPRQLAFYADQAGTDNAHAPWASYWYNGNIYSNNAYGCWVDVCFGTLTRGLDVLSFDELIPGVTPQKSFNMGLQE